MVMIYAVQVGIGHVDFLVLIAFRCGLLFVPDCVTHFHRQFPGRLGSSLCGIDYLAARHHHDKGYQNEQERKRPEDD